MKRTEIPRTTRPSDVPKNAWDKMGSLQQYNLANGLLVYDLKTKRCKRSGLSFQTSQSKSKPRSKLKRNDISTLSSQRQGNHTPCLCDYLTTMN